MPQWRGTYQTPNAAMQQWLDDFARWNASKTGQPWDAAMPQVPADVGFLRPSFSYTGAAATPAPGFVPPDPYQQAQELARRQKLIELVANSGTGQSNPQTATDQAKALSERKPQ